MNTFSEIQGDIFDIANRTNSRAIVCPTNLCVKQNGELVMGRGLAKAFKRKYPALPHIWGQRVLGGNYGLLVTSLHAFTATWPSVDGKWLVAAPTKTDWRQPSTIPLITTTIQQLKIVADALDWDSVVLPRLGCGNGGFSWKRDILSLYQTYLDERFTVANVSTL